MTERARGLAKRVGREEARAALEFGAILLLVPFLPDREVEVLLGVNPRTVWLVVVFVTGLSFLAYLLLKLLHPVRAIGMAGFLGGCVSPSLTVATLGEQHRRQPEAAGVHAFAAAIAATVLFPRVFVLVWIVSVPLALAVAGPLLAMTVMGTTVTVLLWLRLRRTELESLELETPFRIGPALAIGGIVAAIWAAINALGVEVPMPVARTGIILAVVGNLLALVAIAGVAGARRMAWVLGIVWLASSAVGLGLTLLR